MTAVNPPVWPWPGDSPADAARRICTSYRHLVVQAARDDPELAAVLASRDGFWLNLGASWVAPTYSSNQVREWLPAVQLSEVVHVKPKQIYDWGRRGRIRRQMICGEFHYSTEDAIDYQCCRRERHKARWAS
jgi:hypothetical protein